MDFTPRSGALARLVRYGIVGLSSNVLLLLIFTLLLRTKISPPLVAGITYAIGVFGSYLINRTWSFASERRHISASPVYVIVHVGGICSQIAVQYFFHGILGYPVLLVQSVSIFATAIPVFLLLHFVVFPA